MTHTAQPAENADEPAQMRITHTHWTNGQHDRLVAVTGPREVVHGERESFVGGYRWQRSGPAVGSPGLNVGGGST
jgi:hypothetical protein